MPADRWTASTEGRFVAEDLLTGREMSLRDLSVLMPGDVARRAARECFDGAAADIIVRYRYRLSRGPGSGRLGVPLLLAMAGGCDL